MERIAVYGKGGVGKSVVATSLSASWGRRGKRVLHVGCDPKHDSAVRLLGSEQPLRTVLEVLAQDSECGSTESIVQRGRHGVDCCEAGGPEPGVGCGGRGVARTLEYLEETGLMQSGHYDVAVFDVLGDVVCGGFAAPLRQGFAEKVVIVVSEEPMALYAANNICKAIRTYWDNGVVLAGFAANLRSRHADRGFLEAFAATLSSRVLAFLERDPLIVQAERACQTIVDHAPHSPSAQVFDQLGDALWQFDKSTATVPTPLGDDDFFRLMRTQPDAQSHG